ncbi:MAG: YraN family protein [Thermoanaerobaculia bacterium]
MNSSEGEDWKARLKRLGIVRRRRPKTVRKDRRRVESGRGGEDAAARHLEENGLILLERNVRYRNGEIDIVAADGTTTVFVEVKRRKNDARGTPAEAVTSKKRDRVIRAARRWLVENPGLSRTREVRFDVIAIQDDSPSVEWLRGAFDASR